MNKQVLIEVIEHLDKFHSEYKGGNDYTMDDFLGYLNTQRPSKDIEMRKVGGDQAQHLDTVRQESNSDVAILVTLLFRYAKGYIKKALQDSIIQTADEFAFLITLITFESLTKTELISKQVMEKTSGVEVIKRLVGQGLIHEFSDLTDKRSVRVSITDKGKMEVMKVLPEMSKVSRIVVGNLVPSEITTLSYLMKKLDFYHNDIFMNNKNASLDELLK